MDRRASAASSAKQNPPGILEGINSLIQAAKAKARGYQTTRKIIAMAYFIAGKLGYNGLEPLRGSPAGVRYSLTHLKQRRALFGAAGLRSIRRGIPHRDSSSRWSK